jgi:asparagine synthase (glutamine-hydrolysing)
LEIEKKRLFPLSYEPENTEVLIPQRVIGWYMPILDNDVIDVYLTVPPRFKVDNSMFKKVVEIICGSEICRIPDSNTGAPVGASYIRLLYNEYVKILQKRYYGYFKAPQLSTSGSWQNLEFYIHHSRVLQELWVSRNHEAVDLFKYILGYNPFEKPIIEYRGRDKWLFLRLLTLKIWLDLKKR